MSELPYNGYDELDAFTQAYLETAVWHCCNGKTVYDLALDAVNDAAKECTEFQLKNAAPLGEAYSSKVPRIKYTKRAAGHDFWLTRNHYGAAFWDHDLPREIRNQLIESVHAFGEWSLYLRKGGRVYSSY
jgi:hypothetical protein